MGLPFAICMMMMMMMMSAFGITVFGVKMFSNGIIKLNCVCNGIITYHVKSSQVRVKMSD